MPLTDFLFGVPYEDKHIVSANNLEEALEVFCSSVDTPEKFVGRYERTGDSDIPVGYNLKGHRYEVKPKMPATASLPDDEVIQVWIMDESQPHWNTEEPGDHRLVFELPISRIWEYDRWGNVEHPQLPAPESGEIPETSISSLDIFRGKRIRELNRADIVKIKRELNLQRGELTARADHLAKMQSILSNELHFRTEQLRLINVYLGKNFEIVKIRAGKPAPDTDKITLRQRVLYMAEEVGIIGGYKEIDFRSIDAFDEWVSRPENLALISPEEKGVVVIKPRRDDVDYGDPRLNFFLNVENHLTYFLIRNGGNVWRIFANISVGEKLFPEPETFQRMYRQELEDHLRFGEDSWGWSYYEDSIKKREKWKQQLGVTDTDFRYPLRYKTKEEYEEAKRREQQRLQEPEESTSKEAKLYAMEHAYEQYAADFKEYFFALALLQGIIDRTQIFGNMASKVNLFTGLGTKEYCTIVYDATPERLLVDKDTPTVEQWLKDEATKVAKGDYVMVMLGDRGTRIGQATRVVEPGKIIARTWGRGKHRGINHHLLNTDQRLSFFPYNLPQDKLQFYLKRRQDRDRYWKTVLKYLLQLELMRQNKKQPELQATSDREEQWK